MSGPIPGIMILYFVINEYSFSHLISRATKPCHPDPRGTQESGYPKLDISAFRSPTWFRDSSSDQKRSTFCRLNLQGVCRTCSGLALARSTLSFTTSLAFTLRQSQKGSLCEFCLILSIKYPLLTSIYFSSSSSMSFP